ncbi:hypothetical protein E2C01_084451 [Portunus trituberculatus]|uniref:Uncharacterized protein n=1 Tax=Portunus trituberculatus TaxID=210409 RepID=A0A5B7IYA7_PORTR|nr:hypothetical protein [Portunus trituberculatus]
MSTLYQPDTIIINTIIITILLLHVPVIMRESQLGVRPPHPSHWPHSDHSKHTSSTPPPLHPLHQPTTALRLIASQSDDAIICGAILTLTAPQLPIRLSAAKTSLSSCPQWPISPPSLVSRLPITTRPP